MDREEEDDMENLQRRDVAFKNRHYVGWSDVRRRLHVPVERFEDLDLKRSLRTSKNTR